MPRLLETMRGVGALGSAYRRLSYAGGKVPAKTQNIIGGEWCQSSTEKWIDVHNPATNSLVTQVPQTTQAEMEQAVENAKAAFGSWSKTSALSRQQIMFRYQQLIKENIGEIARLITIEQGKTKQQFRYK